MKSKHTAAALLSIGFFAFASLPIVLLPGCATNTGLPAKDSRGRAVNQALVEAGRVLGDVAVSTLFAVARSEATGGKGDWQQAATAGLWANVDAAKTTTAVHRIVSAYSGGKAPMTATAAADAFGRVSQIIPAHEITNAIASVVYAATLK